MVVLIVRWLLCMKTKQRKKRRRKTNVPPSEPSVRANRRGQASVQKQLVRSFLRSLLCKLSTCKTALRYYCTAPSNDPAVLPECYCFLLPYGITRRLYNISLLHLSTMMMFLRASYLTMSALSVLLLVATTTTTTAFVQPLPVSRTTVGANGTGSQLYSSPPDSTSKKEVAGDSSSFDISSKLDLDQLKSSLPDVSALVKSKDSVLDNMMAGEFGSRGEIYFVAQAVLVACIVVGGIPVVGDFVTFLLGPVLLVAGIAVAITGATQMGSSLSPWPVPSKEVTSTGLITSGLFDKVRHPTYAGLLAACAGLSVTTGDATRLLLTAILLYALDVKTDYEEAELQKIFPDYDNYKQDVPGKFFPHELLDLLPWTTAKDE